MSAFNWKIIEEKPENYSDVRTLIEDVVNVSQSSKNIKQPTHVLQYFVKQFGLETLYPNIDTKMEKKGKISKKEEIIIQNEKKVIMEDFEQFELNSDFTIKFITCRYEITSYLYFLWWNVMMVRSIKQKKNVPPLSLLDGILSIHRILEKDILEEDYRCGFTTLYKVLNKIVDEKFYDLLFDNPKLLYHSSFQHFKKNIQLYPEQKQILNKIHDAIQKDEPLLLGNQMPTGQGKTFLSIPLAKLLSLEKRKEQKKTVLFACSNPLVNIDVCQNSLVGNDIHLWLAKIIHINVDQGKKEKLTRSDIEQLNEMGSLSEKILLRPYKRCFPSVWKKVYRNKNDDNQKNGTIQDQWYYYTRHTGKQPDIIVADLDSCLLLLKHQEKIGFPFVAYIDEFISDDQSNKFMAEICSYLPKQTVLLSSVLPKFEFIPSIVEDFCEKYKTTAEKSCFRVSSADVSIPCCVVDPNGYVRFPHHHVTTKEDVVSLMVEMRRNPRVRRTYSPKHVYFWCKTLVDILPESIQFYNVFPKIGDINPKDIVGYVISLLQFLENHFHHLEQFQSYRPQIMGKVDRKNLFLRQSHEYEPKTLVVMKEPLKETIELTSTLFENRPKLSKQISENEKKSLTIRKSMSSLRKQSTSKSDRSVDKESIRVNRMEELEAMEETLEMIKIEIPTTMMINHVNHFKKYNPEKEIPSTVSSLSSMNIPSFYFDHLTEDELYQILSGIGTYDRNHQTEYQRNLMMRLYPNFLFFNSGKEIVYGTNLSGLTNIFLDKEFADTINTCELYQLMGRVGRMGRSYHANIVTSDENIVQSCLSLQDSYEKENQIERLFSCNKC